LAQSEGQCHPEEGGQAVALGGGEDGARQLGVEIGAGVAAAATSAWISASWAFTALAMPSTISMIL
jgi:hypothetical protein